MPDLVERLGKPQFVWKRYSDNIQPVDSTIQYDAEKGLQVTDLQAEIRVTETIDLDSISRVKAIDYTEDKDFRWVLTLRDKGGNMTSFQFRSKEERDIWNDGLRSLFDKRGNIKTDLKDEDKEVSENPYAKIIDVNLKEPQHNPDGTLRDLACAIITVAPSGGGTTFERANQVVIKVPATQSEPEALKRLVHQFVTEHEVNPNECTSLYRFLRAVVQRALVEKETDKIVEEINKANLDFLMTHENVQQDLPVRAKVDEMKIRAEERLHTLRNDLPARLGLGDHGTGASIVAMILKQNIEQMLQINELLSQAYEAESQEGGAQEEAQADVFW